MDLVGRVLYWHRLVYARLSLSNLLRIPVDLIYSYFTWPSGRFYAVDWNRFKAQAKGTNVPA